MSLDGAFLRFVSVGALTTGLDAAVFTALSAVLGWSAVHANVCSYSFGILVSFVLNGSWTFASFDDRSAITGQAFRFVSSNGVGLVLSTLVVAVLAAALPALAAKAISVPIVFLWNYAAARFWVFR